MRIRRELGLYGGVDDPPTSNLLSCQARAAHELSLLRRVAADFMAAHAFNAD
jgi:hypothetical protein